MTERFERSLRRQFMKAPNEDWSRRRKEMIRIDDEREEYKVFVVNSFHLNAARVRRTSNSGRLPGSGGKVMQERSEKRFLHHFSSRPLGRLE